MGTRIWLPLPRNTQSGESLLSKEIAERSSDLKSSELGITLIFISRRSHHSADKDPYSQGYGLSSSHVQK